MGNLPTAKDASVMKETPAPKATPKGRGAAAKFGPENKGVEK